MIPNVYFKRIDATTPMERIQEISAELYLALNTVKRHASVLPGHFIRSICG